MYCGYSYGLWLPQKYTQAVGFTSVVRTEGG